MKNMRSLFVVAVAVCALVPFIAGCGSSDSGGSNSASNVNPIIGTWHVQSISVPSYGLNLTGAQVTGSVTVNADGTLSGTGSYAMQTQSGSGTWSTSNGILTVSGEGQTMNIPYSISGNTLTMNVTYSGVAATVVLVK